MSTGPRRVSLDRRPCAVVSREGPVAGRRDSPAHSCVVPGKGLSLPGAQFCICTIGMLQFFLVGLLGR